MSCGTDGFRFREKFCTRVETCDTNGIARFHDEFCFAKRRSAVSASEASRKPFCGTEIRLYPANGVCLPSPKKTF